MRELLARLNFMGFQFEPGPEARLPRPAAYMCPFSSAVQHVSNLEFPGHVVLQLRTVPPSQGPRLQAMEHHLTCLTTAVSARWSAHGRHEGHFHCRLQSSLSLGHISATTRVDTQPHQTQGCAAPANR